MRDVGREPAFELAITLDSLGHRIKRVAELCELVLAFKVGARFEVALLELLSRISQTLDGLDEVACEEVAEDRRKHNGDDGRQNHRLV